MCKNNHTLSLAEIITKTPMAKRLGNATICPLTNLQYQSSLFRPELDYIGGVAYVVTKNHLIPCSIAQFVYPLIFDLSHLPQFLEEQRSLHNNLPMDQLVG